MSGYFRNKIKQLHLIIYIYIYWVLTSLNIKIRITLFNIIINTFIGSFLYNIDIGPTVISWLLLGK